MKEELGMMLARNEAYLVGVWIDSKHPSFMNKKLPVKEGGTAKDLSTSKDSLLGTLIHLA